MIIGSTVFDRVEDQVLDRPGDRGPVAADQGIRARQRRSTSEPPRRALDLPPAHAGIDHQPTGEQLTALPRAAGKAVHLPVERHRAPRIACQTEPVVRAGPAADAPADASASACSGRRTSWSARFSACASGPSATTGRRGPARGPPEPRQPESELAQSSVIRRNQPVADAPAVDDVAAVLRVQFAPQAARVGVEGPGVAQGPVSPDVPQQLLLRRTPGSGRRRAPEQGELLAGQGRRRSPTLTVALAGSIVISPTRRVPRAALRPPPQHGADPGQQLRILERLDDVVVGARLEAADPIVVGAASGEDDHRQPRVEAGPTPSASRISRSTSRPEASGRLRSRSSRSGWL